MLSSLMNCVLRTPCTNPNQVTWRLIQGDLKLGQRVHLVQGSTGAYISEIQKISVMGSYYVVTTLSGSVYTVEV